MAGCTAMSDPTQLTQVIAVVGACSGLVGGVSGVTALTRQIRAEQRARTGPPADLVRPITVLLSAASASSSGMSKKAFSQPDVEVAAREVARLQPLVTNQALRDVLVQLLGWVDLAKLAETWVSRDETPVEAAERVAGYADRVKHARRMAEVALEDIQRSR